ncbi:MAG: hypothetical protein ACO4B4_00425 [Planctomycetota bacterium]|jgi:hypothetical protein
MSRTVLSIALMLFTVALSPALQAQGTTAVLHDGTVLTTTGELFTTEGPIWDIDLDNRTITVVGKDVTIPLTVDGAEVLISGSSVSSNDAEAPTGIGATNFDRLLDINASDRDVKPSQAGPARSLFSSSEANRTDAGASGTRSAIAQALIQENYFEYLQLCYPAHADVLPADFLQRAGVRGDDQSAWAYPASAGGTLKSAGTIYEDAAGNRYYIPDIEVVIELSENVSGGTVASVDPGGPGIPPSFVIGEMLIIMNQDPRFGADVFGLGELEINPAIFFTQGVGALVDTIGHTVGEHVLFVQEVLTDLSDPANGLLVTAEGFRFRNNKDEIRFRGIVGQIGGVELSVTILGETFPIDLTPDPLTNQSTYTFRSRGDLDVAAITEIQLTATLPGGGAGAAPLFNETILRADVE